MHCNGIDYRDRWRFDADGVRKLTIRRLSVLVRHLPPEAASVIASGGSGWRVSDFLLADVFHANSGTVHPANPRLTALPDPQRERKMSSARVRARERQRLIDAGEIT